MCRWRSCDAKKYDNNFPAEKQYLITERVPCCKRISELESAANAIKEVDLGDGWFEARPPEEAEGQIDDIDNVMQDVDDIDAANNANAAADDDDVADMDDDMADMDADMEAEANNPAAAETDNIFATEEFKQEPETNSAVRQVR